MNLKLALAGIAGVVILVILFPPLMYIAIALLAAWFVTVVVVVRSAVKGEGRDKRFNAEVHRRAQALALEDAKARREAARLDAIDAARKRK